jgi:hypothetical protein
MYENNLSYYDGVVGTINTITSVRETVDKKLLKTRVNIDIFNSVLRKTPFTSTRIVAKNESI